MSFHLFPGRRSPIERPCRGLLPRRVHDMRWVDVRAVPHVGVAAGLGPVVGIHYTDLRLLVVVLYLYVAA